MRHFIIFIALIILAGPAMAADSGWSDGEHSRVRLISAQNAVGQAERIEAALEIDLDEGWHTYWRNAGDTGLAPMLNWDGSTNFKEALIAYPAPRRFEVAGLQSFGYEDGVTLPLQIVPEETGKAISISLNVDLLICKEICIPANHKLSLDLKEGSSERSIEAKIIDDARERLPNTKDHPAIKLDTAILARDAVVVTAFARAGFAEDADVFIEAPDIALNARPEFMPGPDEQNSVFKIAGPEGESLTDALFGKSVRITLVNGDDAVEKDFQF